MNLKLCLMGGAALAAAVAMAAVQMNTWCPAWTAIEPLCAATDWDQEGALNAYFGYESEGETKYDACGCDPLAWGQVVVYHALNHGFPAAGWEPTPVTGRVYFGENDQTGTERTTMSGPYDWEAIRDKVWEKDGEGKTLSCPVGRLMWDLGIIGNAQYGYDTLATCWSNDSSNDATIYTYFNYAGKGYRYDKPLVNQVLQPYWREMLRTLLRTSLQAGAPVVTSIQLSGGGHMVVTDGYGVDANGKEWFHIDYAWQSVKGYWWDLDEFIANVNAVYTFVSPTDLGGVITGRVTTPTGAPVPGITVVVSNGTEARVATTDAAGLYAVTGFALLPTEGLRDTDLAASLTTVTLLPDGADPLTQAVTLRPYIDEALRAKKHNAFENATNKTEAYTFPQVCGSAVADFTLTPRRFFAPEGSGSGRSWADPAALTAEAVAAAAGGELYLAQGAYTLTEALTLPAGATLSGGYDPATGLADPLATPTVLNFQSEENLDACITLSANSELRGVSLTFTSEDGGAQALLSADIALAAKPQVFGVSFPAYSAAYKYAANLALTCCTFACDTGAPQCTNCTFLHCSFYDAAYSDGAATDLGGNRFKVTSGSWRPEGALDCPDKAKHSCPELGLDGRPLGQTQGALAPAGGYTLSLQ